jgi:cysteine desulfurase
MPSLAQGRHVAQPARSSSQTHYVYLDNHASTPCDPRVVEAMLPFFLENFANPSSSIHEAGRRAATAVEAARAQIAATIHAQPGEVLFTSGATESNNLAILGVCQTPRASRRRVLASAIEHKSVLQACKLLARRGFEFKAVPVDPDGLVDLGALSRLLEEPTAMVSIQAVNNEIGTIQPVLEVVQLAHNAGALVHCDAAQALGRIPIDVGSLGVDLLSLSGHKCYGPKGIGALYVRGGVRTAPLEPLAYGGGQEHEKRPGTLNVPGIVGFGRATQIANQEGAIETERIRRLRDWFESRVLEGVPGAHRNGCLARRVAGNSSLTFPGADAEALIANLRDVAISTGSACTSGAPDPSHVLTAIGLSRKAAYSTVRIGIGRFNMDRDLEYAASELRSTVRRLQLLGSDAV